VAATCLRKVPALSIAKRLPNRTPVGPLAGGDAKQMNATGCAAATSKLRSFLNAGCTTAGLEREVVAACAEIETWLRRWWTSLFASAHLWFGELPS